MNDTTQFWLRKLHSLSGGLLLGLFLVPHVVWPGTNLFDRGFVITALCLALPLLFHAGYGAVVIYEATWSRYPFFSDLRYGLQRVSALGIAVFLPLHLVAMNLRPDWIHRPVGIGVWALGGLLACFHLANGLAGFLIHWGVTIGGRSQRVALGILALAGLGLGIRALAGIAELTGGLSFLQPLNALLF